MKKALALMSIVAATAACVPSDPQAIDPLELAVSGKTLVSDTAVLTLNSNGTLSGKVGNELETDIAGTWYVANGRFCRTITTPDRLAGDACQNMRLYNNGTQLEVDGVNRTVRYNIR